MGLLRDFKDQKHKITLFSFKLIVFVGLIFVIDRHAATFLKKGLYQYFGLDKKAEVLAIGYSHTVLGIDKVGVESALGLTMAKYARSGANLLDRKAMMEHYFSLHPSSSEIVVYDVDAHLFTKGGLSRNSYQLFYPFMDDPVIKEHILQANPPWQELVLREIFQTSRYNEMLIAHSMRGWLRKWTNFKSGQVHLERLEKEIESGITRKIEFNQESIQLFMTTLEAIKREGAVVVLAYIPTIDVLNEAEPKKFKQAIALFEKIAEEDNSIYFLNYNERFSSRHELFFDPVHLNRNGQKAVTEALIKDIEIVRK